MSDKNTLMVNETFLSIQGESTFAGLPCFFIRLAGCNLNCSYCDTAYAKKFDDGQPVSIQELVDLAEEANSSLVLITGGEPMLQEAVPALCRALLDAQFQVLFETNGSVALDDLPWRVTKIMDIKLPSSGEADKLLTDNFELLNERDEIKFVIGDRADFDYAMKLIEEHELDEITEKILYSPVYGQLDPKELAGWIISELPMGRMQLQLHKYIWPPETRGV